MLTLDLASLRMLLDDPTMEPFTIHRGGTSIATVDPAIIVPVLGQATHFVPEMMLAGVRSPHVFLATGVVDVKAGDEIHGGVDSRYKVHGAAIWGINAMTMAVVSKPEG